MQIQHELPQLLEEKSSVRPLICVQRQGDLLYLPEHWRHAVLNIGETVRPRLVPVGTLLYKE